MHIKRTSEYKGHSGNIYALIKYSENEFITSGEDGNIVLWQNENPTGTLLVKISAPVYSLYFYQEKDVLLAGTSSGNLHFIDLKLRQEIKNFKIHARGIFSIIYSKKNIITSGGDGKICVISAEGFEHKKTVKLSDESIRCVCEMSSETIACGSTDGNIYILNSDFEMENIIKSAHNLSVFVICFNSDKNYIISGGRDAKLKIRNGKRFDLIKEISAHLLHIHAIQFSPDKKYFVTSSMDKTIKIWDVNNFELLRVISSERYVAHTSSVNRTIWLNNEILVSAGDDKIAISWKIIS